MTAPSGDAASPRAHAICARMDGTRFSAISGSSRLRCIRRTFFSSSAAAARHQLHVASDGYGAARRCAAEDRSGVSYSYPVNLDGLARIFEARRERLPSLRRIFSGSEVLEVRSASASAACSASTFRQLRLDRGVPRVGMPDGSYHVNAEHVIVESSMRPARRPRRGARPSAGHDAAQSRDAAGTLRNRRLCGCGTEGACRCGRTLPLIGAIAGRDINLFFTDRASFSRPGRSFARCCRAPGSRRTKSSQRALDRFVLRYVGPRALSSEDEAEIHRHFESFLAVR